MDTPSQETPPIEAAKALLKELRKEFKAFRECLPLAIGINKLIIERIPDINRKHLRIALSIHTHSLPYLRALERSATRFTIDGEVAGVLEEEHRTHAKAMLQERFKKEIERKKSLREAELREKKAKAEAEAQAQKLNALVERFSKPKK